MRASNIFQQLARLHLPSRIRSAEVEVVDAEVTCWLILRSITCGVFKSDPKPPGADDNTGPIVVVIIAAADDDDDDVGAISVSSIVCASGEAATAADPATCTTKRRLVSNENNSRANANTSRLN